MTNASRAQIDLEALARDLRHEGAAPRPAVKNDPLAELARIVGQDDPFRALLEARNEIGANFVDTAPEEPAEWGRRIEPRFAAEEPQRATPADAFDQYLASVERDRQHYAPEANAPIGFVTEEPEEPYDDARALRRASPRRRLVSVGAGIAVVAVAVTGALTYKGMQSTTGGTIPLVQADTTPLKVAPKVADGVEIPDQNRQIYDRNATSKDSGQIKIVNREEQPLDVAEAARAAGGSPAAQGTTPGNSPFDAFGEPRRVRTVAVKPEAPPAPPPAPVAAAAEPEVSPVPTMVLPSSDPAPAPAPAAKPARPIRSADALATPVMPTPDPVAEAPARPQPKPPAPVAAKKAPQRVASLAPDAGQASPETTQATSAPIDTTSPVGGFSVQLGVRNSASDARAALHQMQAKYSQLAGKPELIRQAEVNGKTIFRVRVGPLAKDQASSLCSALQGEGGQCFVAKN
jgi:hypothetical protein